MLANVKRPTAYVIAPTNHGTMIVNRHDFRATAVGAYGVGYQLLNDQSFDQIEVDLALHFLDERRKFFGDGVVGLDLGANIGVHTIDWARHMFGWGEVFAVEAQKRVYYALAGNIAVNNCFNANAIWAAIGAEKGTLKCAEPNYFVPSSFGSFELIQSETNEFIGQEIDWSEDKLVSIPMITVDSMNFDRLDFIKIDIEGMEESAIAGAKASINKSKPIMMIERIKSDEGKLVSTLKGFGYEGFKMGLNLLMVHESDPCLQGIQNLERA